MAKLSARFANLDSNTMQASGDNLQVKLDGAGGLTSTASGIKIAAAGVTNAMLADEANIAYLNQAENIAAVWAFGTNLPTATADPTTANQLCRKAYVDAVAQGIDAKASVRVATTAALASCTYSNGTAGVGATLTATANGAFPAVDGITLALNERILVKDQASGLQNGIYYLSQVGTGGTPWILTRATDADTASEMTGGAFVFVEEGTTNADSGWICTTDGAVTMGTTALTWTQFSGAGQITAGAGLTKTGNTLDVQVDGSTIEINTDTLRVKDNGITAAKIAAAAIGTGLTGGGGSAIAFAPSTVLTGQAAEIDGDKLDIDWNPSNYTPATVVSFSDNVDNLTSHLKGIDDKFGTLGGASNARRVETFTLAAGDITNKYVTLANTPASAGRVILTIKGGCSQHYGDDFQMNGGTPTRCEWTSLGLDGVLQSGDKLTIEYDV